MALRNVNQHPFMSFNQLAMIWLIVARGVEGIGAGGILGMTMIVIGDIVSLEKRGNYAGFISGTVSSNFLSFLPCSGPLQP